VARAIFEIVTGFALVGLFNEVHGGFVSVLFCVGSRSRLIGLFGIGTLIWAGSRFVLHRFGSMG